MDTLNNGAELEDGSDDAQEYAFEATAEIMPEAIPDKAVEVNYLEGATEDNCQAAEEEYNSAKMSPTSIRTPLKKYLILHKFRYKVKVVIDIFVWHCILCCLYL